MAAPVEVRLALLQGGYVPIPTKGKAPRFNGWHTKLATNANEIVLQAKLYSDHTNTGVLTKATPAVDIDITFLPAAEAIEGLARELFEERGAFLRTDEPFDKISAGFASPDGSHHKIEVLGDGQQVIVDGIHPDTGKPYAWHGGTPLSVPRDDLPYARREDLVDFLAEASKLLAEEFGFAPEGKPKGNGADPDGGQHERVDWAARMAGIISGRDLHDNLNRLGASFRCVMSEDAAIRSLQV